VLSSTILNLYSQATFYEALYDATEEIKMNGELITLYVDDPAIIAKSLEDLQSLLQKVNDISEEF